MDEAPDNMAIAGRIAWSWGLYLCAGAILAVLWRRGWTVPFGFLLIVGAFVARTPNPFIEAFWEPIRTSPKKRYKAALVISILGTWVAYGVVDYVVPARLDAFLIVLNVALTALLSLLMLHIVWFDVKFLIHAWRTRPRKVRNGECPACGCDVTATIDAKQDDCPQCGEPIPRWMFVLRPRK